MSCLHDDLHWKIVPKAAMMPNNAPFNLTPVNASAVS
jgi:hypothetical protein